MNAVDRFLISYLVPEISMFKEPKHGTQNWLTENNNNSQNCDVIRFACRSVSYKIDYNSRSTDSNPLKLCEQKENMIDPNRILVVKATFSVPGPFHSK